MIFDDLKNYFIEEGCDFEKLDRNVYIVKNCINGEVCLIEELEFYSTSTLYHYFFELKVNPPLSLEDMFHIYTSFRKNLDKTQLKK